MKTIKNEKLRAALASEIASNRKYALQKTRQAQEDILQLETLADQLDAAGIAYRACTTCLFIDHEARDKAAFSEVVRRVARAVGSPPDIEVEQEVYRARFQDGKIWVSVYRPDDCQMIEVEETVTRKVLKPHPRCKAALAELEQVG